jgi:hypothetical protein
VRISVELLREQQAKLGELRDNGTIGADPPPPALDPEKFRRKSWKPDARR